MGLKYLYVPSGVQAGTAYGVLPNSADADFSNFTRNSAGSRVDKNGFINTGLGLGSEEVVNGGFDSSASWYTSIATISNSRATFIDGTGAYSNVRQPNVLATNKTYEVTIDVTINSGGGFKIQDGNSNTYKQITESGIHTFRFTSIGVSSTFYISRNQGGVAYNMYVESVSVREVTEVNTDVPRLDHTGGGCPSLLLEPQSTNYLKFSEDFTNNAWSEGGQIRTYGYLSPEGAYNACLIQRGSQNYMTTGGISLTDGATYTISVYLKAKTPTNTTIYLQERGNDYTIYFSQSFTLTEEWVRYEVTGIKGIDNNQARLVVGSIGTGEEFYIWGAQLEQQPYATSYIPNYGTALGETRSADIGGRTGDLSSVVNDDDFEIEFKFSSADDNLFKGITFSDTTSTGGSNYVTFYLRDNKSISNLRFSVGGSNTSLNIGNMPDVTVSRVYKLIKKATYLSLEIDGTEFGRINQSVTFTNALKYLKLKANDNDDSKGLRVDYIKINN